MLDLNLGMTMRWRWRGSAVLGVVATLAGCVIESTGPTATELYRLIDAHCESAVRCGCAWAVTDDDVCTTTLEARWKERFSEGLRRELTYDAACFTAMTENIEERGCTWANGPMPLCESFCAPLHGNQAEGAPCEADADDDGLVSNCAQGLYCLDGTCTAPCMALSDRGEGEPCANEFTGPYDDCAAGLFCSWSSGTCVVAPVEGQPCDQGACADGFYCRWETNTCGSAGGPGEPCFEIPCAEGLTCAWETNTCVMPPGEGQSCRDVECADGFFCDWSNDTGVCRSYAAEGESCENALCEVTLWCNEASLCQAAPGEGEACIFGSVCAEGLACDPLQIVCVAPPAEGEPCPAGECSDGAWCDTATDPVGICTARRANDELCAGHRQCQSGYCPNGFCWALPLEGDDCMGSGVCAGGLVCNGTTCEASLTRGPAACNYAGW